MIIKTQTIIQTGNKKKEEKNQSLAVKFETIRKAQQIPGYYLLAFRDI